MHIQVLSLVYMGTILTLTSFTTTVQRANRRWFTLGQLACYELVVEQTQ